MSALILAVVIQYGWPDYRCVRWSWSGDVYNRKVICLEWKKNDSKGDKKK
jgi:hypothetical protein